MLEEQHLIASSLFVLIKSATVACDRWCEITWDAISRGDRKLGPSNASRMAKASSLARRRFVTQRTSPWKTARELANLLLN